MNADQLRDFASALERLAELRTECGVVPGNYYEFPKVYLVDVDENWVLTWVEQTEDAVGHYTAELERN